MENQIQLDARYLALLGLAESYRSASPPRIKECIQCLEAILTYNYPPSVESRTRCQLGKILFEYTTNLEFARQELEKAWSLAGNIDSFEEVLFESASQLASVYFQLECFDHCEQLLKTNIQKTAAFPSWYCRLIFQLAQYYMARMQYTEALSTLLEGAAYCSKVPDAVYVHILFMLSRGMVLLVLERHDEVHPVLSSAAQLIEQFNGPQRLHEGLKVYFLVMQVTYFLSMGQVKSGKSSLRQLQQSIQTITAIDDTSVPSSPMERFHWLPKEHMCVLVYLVTVMHSLQAGYVEKAQKYADKALSQIQSLQAISRHPLLTSFQLQLLEHSIQCRLVTGSNTTAIREIFLACRRCAQSEPTLLSTHAPQIHTLLGLYAMSMNCLDHAEKQFKAGLNLARERNQWVLIQLNLGLLYARQGRAADFQLLMDSVNGASTQSQSLKAATHFVHGMNLFFQMCFQDARHFLRETLKLSNAEDLNRLTACSLVVMGNIYFSSGSVAESMNMITPALQLASKIPDTPVQVWASKLLKDLYQLSGDTAQAAEGGQLHEGFTQTMLRDSQAAQQLPEHNLILWTDGPFPSVQG